MGGAVRSVVNSREPGGEGGHTMKGLAIVPGEDSSDLQNHDTHIEHWASIMCNLPNCRTT